MTNEYKIIKNEVVDKLQPWQLYCSNDLIKSYIDRNTAEGVMEKLKQLDKLRSEAPNLNIISSLEVFIKSI